LHFVHQGHGAPPLVFVHGFACSHEDWKFQLEHFSKTNEIAACDLRAHGRTPGRVHECSIEHYGGDVAALVNMLELRGVFLVGHSMGCRVVLEAARLLAKRVAGVVLVDGSRAGSGNPDAAEATARAQIAKDGYPAFAEHLFRQMFFKPSAEAEAIVQRAVKSSASFGAELWPRMARWDAASVEGALEPVRGRILAIQSTTRNAQLQRAPMKPGESSPWLDLLKSYGAKVEIIPDTGHFTQLEAPQRVNQLIQEFLNSR
jgi:pimeloyl-ACP methyl ester carboxylesterase